MSKSSHLFVAAAVRISGMAAGCRSQARKPSGWRSLVMPCRKYFIR